MRHLLTSCYCTPSTTTPALCEAAAKGHVDVVKLLVGAGSSIVALENGKTAFHRACEEGQEETATALIIAMESRDQAYFNSVSGQTAFELARQQELGGCARRLEAKVKDKFGEASS